MSGVRVVTPHREGCAGEWRVTNRYTEPDRGPILVCRDRAVSNCMAEAIVSAAAVVGLLDDIRDQRIHELEAALADLLADRPCASPVRSPMGRSWHACGRCDVCRGAEVLAATRPVADGQEDSR